MYNSRCPNEYCIYTIACIFANRIDTPWFLHWHTRCQQYIPEWCHYLLRSYKCCFHPSAVSVDDFAWPWWYLEDGIISFKIIPGDKMLHQVVTADWIIFSSQDMLVWQVQIISFPRVCTHTIHWFVYQCPPKQLAGVHVTVKFNNSLLNDSEIISLVNELIRNEREKNNSHDTVGGKYWWIDDWELLIFVELVWDFSKRKR